MLSRSMSVLGDDPFGRPSMIPSAFRKANASFVLNEIRFRSISATNPKAKQRILLFIESSKRYFSLTVYMFIPFFRQVPIIVIMSVRFLLRRDTSETMRVSPFFICEMVRPSFLPLYAFLPLTISTAHLSIVKLFAVANRLISSF